MGIKSDGTREGWNDGTKALITPALVTRTNSRRFMSVECPPRQLQLAPSFGHERAAGVAEDQMFEPLCGLGRTALAHKQSRPFELRCRSGGARPPSRAACSNSRAAVESCSPPSPRAT